MVIQGRKITPEDIALIREMIKSRFSRHRTRIFKGVFRSLELAGQRST